jgi:hypothetical protein
MTCREQYNHYVNERLVKTPHYCSLDDGDGEPKGQAVCPNIDNCDDLWLAVCEECPKLKYQDNTTDRCVFEDETRRKE